MPLNYHRFKQGVVMRLKEDHHWSKERAREAVNNQYEWLKSRHDAGVSMAITAKEFERTFGSY